MSSTHLSLYYHLVFSTKGRCCWITGSLEERLHCYLGGILRGLSGTPEGIGGTGDHVYLLASLKATHCLSDVMRVIKSCSSEWIHKSTGHSMFGWQDGYGAFTVGRLEVETIKRYIRGQKEHHRKKTFQEEYLELLKQSCIDFDEKYLW